MHYRCQLPYRSFGRRVTLGMMPMSDHAANLRRLMARSGLTLQDVAERTGLHERTLKGILAGTNKPHARTLHRLAEGLGVNADELFQDPSLLA